MLSGQDFVVFVLVGISAAYLWRTWFGAGKTGGCGKCDGCETPKKVETPLVQIDLNGSWKGK